VSNASGFGVTPTGFVPMTEADLIAAETADLLATIAADLDVSPLVPLGALVAVDASHNAELWEVGQVAYNATNRAAAVGPQLDNIGALSGCPRQRATYSSVWCGCAFTAPGTYAAGSLVGFIEGLASQQASNQFAVIVPSINPANGRAVSVSNPYYAGPPPGGAAQYAPAVLFIAPIVGPNFGNLLVDANALLPGNVGSFTGQVPVSGWLSLVDLSTPAIGAFIETDAPYRLRQVQDLGAQGSCTLDAIRVDVIEALQEAPATVNATCTVYENDSDVIDANGLLPHSYQVVVFDGLSPNTVQNDPIIGQQIWNNKVPGIRLYGTTAVTVLDRQGASRTVNFTRPTPVPVFIVINVTIASTTNAAQVVTAIVDAITAASQGAQFTAYGTTVVPNPGAPSTLNPGVDVIPQAFQGVAQAQAGVVQVTSVLVGKSATVLGPGPLRIDRAHVAQIASGAQGTGIVVNASVFSP
jgi:hypothetical protein